MLPQGIKTTTTAHILIVDDDHELQLVIKGLLEAEGYSGTTAGSFKAACELVDAEAWDLVITDLCLEPNRLDGLDLIDHIISKDNTIPVILLTGYGSIPRAVDAIRRGAVDCMTKPFDCDTLLRQVQKALQERRLRIENRRLQAEVNKTAVIEKLNRELDQRVNELYRLYSISEGLNDVMERTAIFERIVRLAADVTDANRVALFIYDRSRQLLRVRAALGLGMPQQEFEPVKAGRNLISRAGLSGRISHPATDDDALEGYPEGMAVPLLVGGEVFGVIALGEKLNGLAFTRDDEQIMLALVEKAGIRLENHALYEGIYSNLIDTLTSLVSTLEAKDPYTREHSQRVTDYAVALGRHMRLGDDALEMIQFAGMLHDIGKIGVQDGILTKSGRLTEEEYAQIKQHPLIGERIVAPLGLVDEERSIIRHHHERFDGRGYPDGLKGEDIPLLARIVSVTDAFDAMTTTRSYRKAMPVRSALNEMRACAGSQFDPTIVRLWIMAYEAGQIRLNIPPAGVSTCAAS